MSTKATIAHSSHFHIYKDVFEDDKIYLQIDKHEGYVKIENNKVTISLSPSLLNQIAQKWLETKQK
tara:strand:+ start:428 stop:625 length:198 start_codon:yes stop_codon:yes gene_type:complete